MRFRIELDGFPTEVVEADTAELAWDRYKVAKGRRRHEHNKTPIITNLDDGTKELPGESTDR